MTKDIIIYYYDKCPKCGNDVNDKVCPYCGTSLIKSQAYSQDLNLGTTEQAYYDEDSQYPVIECCAGKLHYFSLLFGGIFTFVGLVVLIASIPLCNDQPGLLVFMLLFSSIFILVGVFSMFKNIREFIKTKKIQSYGSRIVGEVRGYQNTNTSVNGRILLAVRVLIHDPDPKILVIDTASPDGEYDLDSPINIKVLNGEYALEK